ncbi:hypothetical protein IFM89_023304 [Coptis chinensis]|uniref:Uncharacterized protein n=1 Tax=Coptis chinensis TaxID=261450 RepID=A0A835GXL5_9MAGN|nr:hypothetical protein IFM89_023304 [Coptis chinensis]
MERRKSRAGRDELATKAAAWAWYQRGLVSEGKLMQEFSIRRIHRVPRPSRFKLEYMKRTDETMENSESSLSRSWSPTHSENSLLDQYEIEMISKHLDRLLEADRGIIHRACTNDQDHQKKQSLQENDKHRKIIRKISNKVWLRRTPALCGSKGDVVEPRTMRRKHRQLHG